MVRPAPSVVTVEAAQEARGLSVKLPGLSEAAQAIQKASQIDQRVEERMHQVEQRMESHGGTTVTRTVAPDLAQARAMLRQPQSLRAAVIASVILGRPKALEN